MPLLESIALKGLTVLTTSIAKKFAERGWTTLATEFNAAFTKKASPIIVKPVMNT